ncbi:MAG: hypothetical protein KID08_23755, partial [Pseudomonas putida]|nr:hypothetical protein [Pseudomonas putida]
SASAKVICFIGKLRQRGRRISPDLGSLLQDFPNHNTPSGQQAASQALALARLVVAVSQTRSSS